MPIGIPELLIVLVIVLLILGPKRLPGLGRSLGGGFREFKHSIKGGGDAAEPPTRPAIGEPEALDGEVVSSRSGSTARGGDASERR
ncbi:MAG: twin-arginine translocase TatA/TatE family subunit [Solirubrobacteraceae bacterium]